MRIHRRSILTACAVWFVASAAAPAAQASPTPPPAGPSSTAYYLISLDEAPLAEAAEAVLIQSLGSATTIDAGLEAEITFRVAEAMTATELAEAFSVALADEGVALLRTDDGFRLMDMQAALAQRPRPDMVSIAPPELRPGALEALRASAPSDAAGAPPAPSSISPWLILAGSLAAVAAVSLALIVRRPLRGGWRPLRDRPVGVDARSSDRDAVVDRLLQTEDIDLALLARACDTAARQHRPVEQVLCDIGAVSDEALAQACADVTGLKRWSVGGQRSVVTDPGLDRLQTWLQDRAMALIEADAWSVVVATSDPLDDAAFATMSRLSRRMVTLMVASRSDLERSIWKARPVDTLEPTRHSLIIPWARPARPDGAALLQAILTRKIQPSADH